MSISNREWRPVSKDHPCPVCGHTDWCIYKINGEVCVCRRVPSTRPCNTDSGGWTHFLVPFTGRSAPSAAPRPAARPAEAPVENVSDYFNRIPLVCGGRTQRDLCAKLGKDLGLPEDVLFALDWRWDPKRRAVAIPMREPLGEVVGIRYRDIATGRKWALRGSKDGLFFDPQFVAYDPGELVVCEGPTDQAAATVTGMWPVGRSCCTSGARHLRELVRIQGVRRVTIVADDDPPKPKPGGGTWRPGYDGAKALGAALGVPYRIVLPPDGIKDLRAWYNTGTLTAESFADVASAAKWQGPDETT